MKHFVLKTKDNRWIDKAKLVTKVGYTNLKNIEYSLTGVIREAEVFAEKEAHKWQQRLKDLSNIDVTIEDIKKYLIKTKEGNYLTDINLTADDWGDTSLDYSIEDAKEEALIFNSLCAKEWQHILKVFANLDVLIEPTEELIYV